MLLTSSKKEEKMFCTLEKEFFHLKIFFFPSPFGSGEKRFLVSFAGGEVQLPGLRITRRFNRDKLSALLCTYNKRWVTDVIGNRLLWFTEQVWS